MLRHNRRPIWSNGASRLFGFAGLFHRVFHGGCVKAIWRERWCLSSLLGLGLVGCAKVDAKGLGPPDSLGFSLQAAGDTARGFFSWSAARGATNYRYSVAVINTTGSWIGLPQNVSTTGRSGSFVAVNATADSGDFVACVKSYNATDSTAATCSVPKRWRRGLQPVPLVIWDSLKVAVIQKTGPVCFQFALPDSLTWQTVSLDSLSCPPIAWFPGRNEFLATDNRGVTRTCIVTSQSGYGWPWPEPPLDGKVLCLWWSLAG